MGAVPGRFNDGRTAASREVKVVPTQTGLELRGEDGLLIAFWRREDLVSEGPLPGGNGIRLRCAADTDARLSLDRHDAISHLLPTRRRTFLPWRVVLACAAATVLLCVGLWKGVPAGAGKLAMLIPTSLEQQWGDQLADGLQLQSGGVCGAPAGEAALRLLSDRLAAGMPPDLRPRKVVVVKKAINNAVALPGGTVIIFNGLLLNADNGDEVAGVLAHELTHLALRHPTAAMIRAMGVGAMVTLLTGDASGLVASAAAVAVSSAYSREDEAAADRGAVELLTKAGLTASGLSSFFRRLAQQEGGVIPVWISTHPESGDRADMVDTMIAGRTGMAALSDEQWTALKDICR